MLVLAPWEEYFLDEIKDLPIKKSSFVRLDPDIKVKVCRSYLILYLNDCLSYFIVVEFILMAGSRSFSVMVLYRKYKINGGYFFVRQTNS